jgi:hypothetical protein
MMDPLTHAYLQTLIRQEGRSMLQYVGESFPWTTPENEGILKVLAVLIDDEKRMVEDLTRFMLRHRGRPAMLGAYPMSFTNINFISLDHLLPRLVSFQHARITDIEKHEKLMLDSEVRAKVHEVLEMKLRHLSSLEDLVARRVQPSPLDKR